MKYVRLTASETSELRELHKASRDRKTCDRIKAVLMYDTGWSIVNIAKALLLTDDTIRQHLADYFQHKKLSPESGGSDSHLTEQQTAELVAHLHQQLYATKAEIAHYIEQTYGVTYSIPGLQKWLERNGFVYKKPKGIPHKHAPEQQEAFIDSYEELKESLSDDERIIFMDSVHPSQGTKLSFGWIRKGKKKAVKTSATRTRINLVGAIELGQLSRAVTRQYKQINAESITWFLKALREQYPLSQRLHIILDGAGYHKAQRVKEVAEQLNICLHELPPYSPNLNPIERLWKVMNEQVRNNYFFTSSQEFRQRINEFFTTTLPRIGDSLNGRINDHFQRLETEF